MNGTDRFLLDTNVLIALDANHPKVVSRIDGITAHISFVSEIELLSFRGLTSKQRNHLKEMISHFTVIDVSAPIKNRTIELRIKHNIKLPDALIAATSIEYQLPLITADKGFERIPELECIVMEL